MTLSWLGFYAVADSYLPLWLLAVSIDSRMVPGSEKQ